MTGRLGTLVTYAAGAKRAGKDVAEARRLDVPTVLDSGAWSVHTGKAAIGREDHGVFATALATVDPTVRCIGLDVIGDAASSWANWSYQREMGAPVEPTLHYPENPALIRPYLPNLHRNADGYAWINLGGLARVPDKDLMRVVQWAAAVRMEAMKGTEGVAVHALAATNPVIYRSIHFDATDSTYWIGNVTRHRLLSLFDPTIGNWVRIPCAQRNPKGRKEGWVKAHRYGGFLRRVYGVAPLDVLDGDDALLQRLAIKSQAMFARWAGERHKAPFTVYLAATSAQHQPVIAEQNAEVAA